MRLYHLWLQQTLLRWQFGSKQSAHQHLWRSILETRNRCFCTHVVGGRDHDLPRPLSVTILWRFAQTSQPARWTVQTSGLTLSPLYLIHGQSPWTHDYRKTCYHSRFLLVSHVGNKWFLCVWWLSWLSCPEAVRTLGISSSSPLLPESRVHGMSWYPWLASAIFHQECHAVS